MKITEKNYLTRSGNNYEVKHNAENIKPVAHRYEAKLTIKVFPKDIHVSSYIPSGVKKKTYKKRGKISKLSFPSSKRLKMVLRNVADKMEYEAGLTYPKGFSSDGILVKKHFHKLRSWFNYYGYKYVWIMEFQGRGAPHFHLLLNKEIKKEALIKIWFKIVGSGDLKHLKHGVHVGLIRNKGATATYFNSYVTKKDQKHVPKEYQNVGRFWGYSHSLLECAVKNYYGSVEGVNNLKKQTRPMRRWFDGQKRSWRKKKKYTPKKFKNKYIRRGQSFKVINSNLFIEELKKRGIDTSLYEG